jgi:hypothetical protein
MRNNFILIFILLALLSCSKETEFGTRGKWKKYGQNDVGTFYFDKSSIVKTGFKEVLVWDYLVLSPEHAEAIGEAIPELSGIVTMLNQVKIDCQGNRYSQMRIIQYNKERNAVYDSERDGKDLSPVANRPMPEDSAIERLSQIVCRVSE